MKEFEISIKKALYASLTPLLPKEIKAALPVACSKLVLWKTLRKMAKEGQIKAFELGAKRTAYYIEK